MSSTLILLIFIESKKKKQKQTLKKFDLKTIATRYLSTKYEPRLKCIEKEKPSRLNAKPEELINTAKAHQ